MLKSTPTERKAMIARLESALAACPNSDIESTLNLLKDYAALEIHILNLVSLHDEILLLLTNGKPCNEEIDGLMIEFNFIPRFMSNHPEVQKIKLRNDASSNLTNPKGYTEVNRVVSSYASECIKCKNLKLNFRAKSRMGNLQSRSYCTNCYGVCLDCGKEGVFHTSGVPVCYLCKATKFATASSSTQSFKTASNLKKSVSPKKQSAPLKTQSFPQYSSLLKYGGVNPKTGLPSGNHVQPCATCGKLVTKGLLSPTNECSTCYNITQTSAKPAFLGGIITKILRWVR